MLQAVAGCPATRPLLCNHKNLRRVDFRKQKERAQVEYGLPIHVRICEKWYPTFAQSCQLKHWEAYFQRLLLPIRSHHAPTQSHAEALYELISARAKGFLWVKSKERPNSEWDCMQWHLCGHAGMIFEASESSMHTNCLYRIEGLLKQMRMTCETLFASFGQQESQLWEEYILNQ